MAVLFGVDFPVVIAGALGGLLEAGTLHVASETFDDYRQAVRTFVDEPVEGVVDSWDTRTIVARGWPATTVLVLVLGDGITPPKPGDEITIRTQRYRIVAADDGGALATYELAAVAV